MTVPDLSRAVIEAEAIGGPFCGYLLTGYRRELLACSVEGGQMHRYLLESDEGAWIWRYAGRALRRGLVLQLPRAPDGGGAHQHAFPAIQPRLP